MPLRDEDAGPADKVLEWELFGLVDIPCPVCRHRHGRKIAIGFLGQVRDSDSARIRGLVRWARDDDEPDDGLPQTAGDYLTQSAKEAVHLSCPACQRTFGPYSANALLRRLKAGLPLTVL